MQCYSGNHLGTAVPLYTCSLMYKYVGLYTKIEVRPRFGKGPNNIVRKSAIVVTTFSFYLRETFIYKFPYL